MSVTALRDPAPVGVGRREIPCTQIMVDTQIHFVREPIPVSKHGLSRSGSERESTKHKLAFACRCEMAPHRFLPII